MLMARQLAKAELASPAESSKSNATALRKAMLAVHDAIDLAWTVLLPRG
jgi:hypothetical protein